MIAYLWDWMIAHLWGWMIEYPWDWSILWRHPYGGWMWQGMLTTVHLSLISWVFALTLGIIVGSLRTSPWSLIRLPATAYVEFFRDIPLLVQLFFWYFAAPMLLPREVMQWIYQNLGNPEYGTAVVALSIYTSSRVAEQIRSGLRSISKDHYHAALATGLSRFQMYRYVILPYALRIMIPPLTAEFLTIFKNSALAMTIAVAEVTFASMQIDAYTFHGFEATTAATLVYLLISLTISIGMRLVESKTSIPGMIRRQ